MAHEINGCTWPDPRTADGHAQACGGGDPARRVAGRRGASVRRQPLVGVRLAVALSRGRMGRA